jgi:hypothetical protein
MTETLKHIILLLPCLKLLLDRLLLDRLLLNRLLLNRLLLDRLLLDRKLLDKKLLVNMDKLLDEPLYALHFLRSLMKQKEKRKNLKYRKRNKLIYL